LEAARLRRAAGAASLGAALALAACGGPSEDEAKRAYVRKLDAICSDGDRIGAESERRLAAVRRRRDSSPRELADGIAGVVADELPRIRRNEGRLRRIRPPGFERRFHTAFLANAKRIDDLYAAGGGAAFNLDFAAYVEAGRRIRATAARQDRLVKRHGGFRHCGS
jgi:hypothetical protein